MRLLLPAGLLLLSMVSHAQQSPPSATPKEAEPPPLPEEGAVPEPEVRIIHKGEETLREYRVQGKLVAVQVIPKHGAPYYLVDADGDGSLETRSNDLEPNILIPGWVIKRW